MVCSLSVPGSFIATQTYAPALEGCVSRIVRLLLLSLSPFSCSSIVKFTDGGCNWVMSESLIHTMSGLGLPVARQEKVAS